MTKNNLIITPPPPLLTNTESKKDSKNIELTIITAFYQLKNEFKGRSSQKYIDYFAFNAGLKNTFIIYCDDSNIASKVAKIREQKAPDSKTIIIQKPLDSIAPNEYQKIIKIFYPNTKEPKDSIKKEIPLHAIYSYLMYCKSCFVLDSISNPLSKNHISENLLWFDFGFNHGGSLFYKSSELNFTLIPQSSELSNNKFNLFTMGLADDKNKPFMINGCLSYGNVRTWGIFNTRMKAKFNEYIALKEFPDDQGVAFACARENPNEFNMLFAGNNWFENLFYFIPLDIAKSLSVRNPCIMNKTLNQKQILKYMQDTHLNVSIFKKLYRKLKRSTQKRFFETKILFEKMFNNRI